MKILNLTLSYDNRFERASADIFEPTRSDKETINDLLTFKEIPTRKEVNTRATALADLAEEYGAAVVMIYSPPWMAYAIERALETRNIKAVYPFYEPAKNIQEKPIFRLISIDGE